MGSANQFIPECKVVPYNENGSIQKTGGFYPLSKFCGLCFLQANEFYSSFSFDKIVDYTSFIERCFYEMTGLNQNILFLKLTKHMS